MKTITTNRLTSTYLSRVERFNYGATALSIVIIVLSIFWMLFSIGSSPDTTLFAKIIHPTAIILSAFWAFQTAWRARYGAVRLEPRYQLAWLLIGLGLIIQMAKGFYYGYLIWQGHDYAYLMFQSQNAFQSGTIIFALLYYPCIFLGLIIMPSTVRFRARTVLDALITTLCIFGILWFFMIGPAYFLQSGQPQGSFGFLGLFVSLTYPCADFFIMLAIILLIYRETEQILRFSLFLLGLSSVALVWADSALAYISISTGKYQFGNPFIDPFWGMSILLIGLAGIQQYTALTRKAYHEQTNPLKVSVQAREPILKRYTLPGWNMFRPVQGLIIYLPLIVLLCLAIFGEVEKDSRLTDILSVLTAFIGGLIATRSFLATRENEQLLHEREQQHKEAERLQHIATYLTAAPTMERLRERIVTMATDELGLDAAMLLLVEEHNRSFLSLPHFFVNATTTSTDITQWNLQGDNLLSRILMEGKRAEVRWTDNMTDVPDEICAWSQEQHIAAMMFFPIIYHEKKLGSIGVTRRNSSYLGPHEIAIITTYAEQVAAIVEHGFVYRDAQEREIFSRAMANISARLNSAVVEPAEISQLICREGAYALEADYVILYIANEEGNLTPLAAYIEKKPALDVEEWPIFHISEYQALVHQLHEPLLIEVMRRPSAITNLPLTSISQEMHLQISDPGLPRDLGHRAHPLRMKMTRLAIPTAIFAPLIAGGKPVGMLVIARWQPSEEHDKRPLDLSDLPEVEEFVKQAGVAFNNARLYQHLRAAHQRLQDLDKLKDQFMITASHELRTPLTAVQGYIELIAQYDEHLPHDQRREFLLKARRGCEELVLLLGNVMDASQLDMDGENNTSLTKRVSVQEIVESVIVLIEPQVQQEKREVCVQIPSYLSVHADPVRLRQVLMNVSVNALKYSPPGAPITFSAHIPLDNELYVIISIADKGKGVPLEDQANLFQRFFRLESDLNSPIRGSGLGLYISRRLIEAMNGKIWIESKGIPGEGSTFHIQLPCAH
ncbi:MAG TPA: ATP-binding protein [Ktedonobacteraceae bacterium]|nr:ATP-binding protein [Ktedonobacteraceae bacterium]